MNRLLSPLFILLIIVSSCGTGKQFGNTEDDVYYSKKQSKGNVVIIKDVDVDSIIKANPPKYGDPRPTNRVDDETANPNAAAGYPAYKAEQDSLYKLYPHLSGYYDPNPIPPFDEREEARNARREQRRLRNLYRNNYGFSNNWNFGLGYGYGLGWGNNWGWGPSVNFGWNNRWGWNSGWGYNNWGWNNWGCNTWYDPWCNNGWGWNNGWNNPYWGWNGPSYWHSDNNNNGSGNNSNSQPISRPRPGVGGSSPPAVAGANTSTPSGTQMLERPVGGTESKPGSGTTLTPGAARLENINGRVVYIPPANQTPPPAPSYQSYQTSVQQSEAANKAYEQYRPAPPANSNNRQDNSYQQQGPPPGNNGNVPSYNRSYAPPASTPPASTPPPSYSRPSTPSYQPPPSGGGGRPVGGSGGGGSRPASRPR